MDSGIRSIKTQLLPEYDLSFYLFLTIMQPFLLQSNLADNMAMSFFPCVWKKRPKSAAQCSHYLRDKIRAISYMSDSLALRGGYKYSLVLVSNSLLYSWLLLLEDFPKNKWRSMDVLFSSLLEQLPALPVMLFSCWHQSLDLSSQCASRISYLPGLWIRGLCIKHVYTQLMIWPFESNFIHTGFVFGALKSCGLWFHGFVALLFRKDTTRSSTCPVP